MAHALPSTVARLLAANDSDDEDRAWAAFVSEYSRLVLHVAHARGGGHDAVMDRYAYALEQLRRNECRRVRRYVADGRGKFTTWLVVVVRRLCIDYERRLYGRAGDGTSHERRARASLVALSGPDVEQETLPLHTGPQPDAALRQRELLQSLRAALSDLEEQDRLLLRLRFDDDVPVAEIAQRLGFPTIFHVYRRLNQVVERLRGSLRRAGLEDASP